MSPFVMQEEETRDEADVLVLLYDQKNQPIDAADAGAPAPAGKIIVFLRHLRGRHSRLLSDMMMEISKGGQSRLRSGAVARKKVCLSVIAMEGLSKADGAPVTKMTPEVYDDLPIWITDAIYKRVNEINAQPSEDEEGE